MGMHFGVIAARTTWPSLLAAVSQKFGTFKDLGAVSDLGHLPFGQQDDGIVAGEYQGTSYILAISLVLPSSNRTAFQDISRQLDCLLAVCVGETVSGTFELFVVDRGELRRFYSNCAMSVSRPLDFGEHLASEASVPLEDMDGRGLFAAMKSLGLDFEEWHARGPKNAYLWEQFNEDALSDQGTAGKMLDEHYKKYQLPKEQQQFKPTVVARRLPDGSMGYDVVSRPLQKSWFGRLFSLFR